MKLCHSAFVAGALSILLASGAGAQGTTPGSQDRPQGQGGSGQSTSPGKSSQMGDTGALSGFTKQFLEKAMQGGQAEVMLGQMAAERASDADVKAFGRRMVQDHGKANTELTSLATQKGWTPPVDPLGEHKAAQQKLEKLSGAEFDRAYMQEMVKDHEKDVSLFEQATRQVQDPELRAFADRTLPTLKQHLEQARSLQARVGGGASKSQKSGDR